MRLKRPIIVKFEMHFSEQDRRAISHSFGREAPADKDEVEGWARMCVRATLETLVMEMLDEEEARKARDAAKPESEGE